MAAHAPSPDLCRAWLASAKAEGLEGFGGRCGEAAVAINRVLFAGQGKLVGAFNDAFLDHGRLIGHVAVAYNGILWDADGRPKEEADIESWGMLDLDDPDYQAIADGFGVDWNDETSSGVSIVEFEDENELLGYFGTEHLEGFVGLLERTRPAVS